MWWGIDEITRLRNTAADTLAQEATDQQAPAEAHDPAVEAFIASRTVEKCRLAQGVDLSSGFPLAHPSTW